MIGILSQWKAIVYAVAFLALLSAGWWVAARITRSYAADRFEKEVKLQKEQILEERKLRVKTEHDARVLTEQLSEAQAQLTTRTAAAIRRVKVSIPEKPDCDFPDDIVGVLNAARRGTLPPAAVVTTPVAPPVFIPPSETPNPH